MNHPALTSPIAIPVRNAGGYLIPDDRPREEQPRSICPVYADPVDRAEAGCRDMLRRMLMAGQHRHTFPDARTIAERIGLDPALVKPGIGA